MKRILLGLLTIFATITLVAGVTRAVFSDTETSTGNTFTAGSLDLEVDGENDPLTFTFSAEDMSPGNTYGSCVLVENVGSIDGLLTLEVSDPVSNENGLIEPEEDDGDTVATEHDPNSYDANTGDGELWDQVVTRLCLDNGPGAYGGNGQCDTGIGETIIYSNFGTPSNDYSSHYSLPLDSDLVGGTVSLDASENETLCLEIHFVDDTTNWWWGGQSGLTNNMAMSDDVVFDVIFGLVQP